MERLRISFYLFFVVLVVDLNYYGSSFGVVGAPTVGLVAAAASFTTRPGRGTGHPRRSITTSVVSTSSYRTGKNNNNNNIHWSLSTTLLRTQKRTSLSNHRRSNNNNNNNIRKRWRGENNRMKSTLLNHHHHHNEGTENDNQEKKKENEEISMSALELFPFVDPSIASILAVTAAESWQSTSPTPAPRLDKGNRNPHRHHNETLEIMVHHIFHINPATWRISISKRKESQQLQSTAAALPLSVDDTKEEEVDSSVFNKNNDENPKEDFCVSMFELQQLAQDCDEVVFSSSTMSKVASLINSTANHGDGSDHDGDDDNSNNNNNNKNDEDDIFILPISSFLCNIIQLASSSTLSTSYPGDSSTYSHTESNNKHNQNAQPLSSPSPSPSPSSTTSSPEIFLATLVALNGLESAIRTSAGFDDEISTGRAPLLKHMLSNIQIIEEEQDLTRMIRSLLEALLLPTGLNLRNLVWHGFIGTSLPRCWLSLIIVLTIQLERKGQDSTAQQVPQLLETKITNNHKNNNNNIISPTPTKTATSTAQQAPIVSLREYPLMEPILQRGQELCRNPSTLEALSFSKVLSQPWLQQSQYHTELWKLVVNLIVMGQHQHRKYVLKEKRNENQSRHKLQLPSLSPSPCPACIACLLSILIEHGLRQTWCRVNGGVHYLSKAHPDEYYVTLDGHGQKQKHDLLLHPYYYYYDNEEGGGRDAKRDSRRQQQQQGRANHLIRHVGGSVMALLTDLFCTPSGPNLRAQLCHGMYDRVLEHELTRMNSNQCQTHLEASGISYRRSTQENFSNDANFASDITMPATFTTRHHNSTGDTPKKENEEWWDVVGVLLVALEGICSSSPLLENSPHSRPLPIPVSSLTLYRPLFSYTAIVMENIQEALTKLEMLSDEHKKIKMLSMSTTSQGKNRKHSDLVELFEESVTWDDLKTLKDTILLTTELPWMQSIEQHFRGGAFDAVSDDPSSSSPTGVSTQSNVDPMWSPESVFQEHACNVAFSSCTAARALLADVANAAIRYTDTMQEASRECLSIDKEANFHSSNGKSSKATKRLQKLCSTADTALSMYKFFAYVALLLIQDKLSDMNSLSGCNGDKMPFKNDSIDNSSLQPQTLLKAVERSRMCVSTMDRFLIANSDRAIKAATEFSKGKATKQILHFVAAEKNDNDTGHSGVDSVSSIVGSINRS